MNRIIVALVCATCAVGVTTPAAARHKTFPERYSSLYRRVAKLHGARAPGRDIIKYGVRYRWVSSNHKGQHWGVRPATIGEIRRSMRTLRQMTAPWTAMLSAVPPGQPPSMALTLRATGGAAVCIRGHESGGDYGAVDSTGKYRGAYQFDYATFAAAGGHGDPAAASPAEQDAAFARWWPGHHGAWPRTSKMCGF